MKRSLIFSCALLVIGGFWAWQNQQQLEDKLREKRRAIAEAVAAGMSPEVAQGGAAHHPKRRALRQENDEVKNLVEKIHLLSRGGKDPLSLLDPESEFYQSKEEIRDAIEALKTGQLIALIDLFLADNPMANYETEMMKYTVFALSRKDPERSSL